MNLQRNHHAFFAFLFGKAEIGMRFSEKERKIMKRKCGEKSTSIFLLLTTARENGNILVYYNG